MTSKAERKRRKRTVIVAMGGRPRKDGPREPNGRLDRAEGKRSAVRTATEARQRLFGLPAAVASQPDAMTVLGRLKLAGEVSPDQADAARRYQELRVRYQRAIGVTPDYSEPAPEEASSGANFEEWVAATKDQHKAMMDCLADLCCEVRSPAPKAALDVIVHRDIDMYELRGALRLALNALARYFGGIKLRDPEMAA